MLDRALRNIEKYFCRNMDLSLATGANDGTYTRQNPGGFKMPNIRVQKRALSICDVKLKKVINTLILIFPST